MFNVIFELGFHSLSLVDNMNQSAFMVLLLLQEASLTGILELKMKTFNNPSHRIPRGRCCDTILPPCNKNRCDNYFKKICLTAPNGMNCGIGNTATGVIRENTDNINFGVKINNVSNPIVYTFAKWEVYLLFLNYLRLRDL